MRARLPYAGEHVERAALWLAYLPDGASFRPVFYFSGEDIPETCVHSMRLLPHHMPMIPSGLQRLVERAALAFPLPDPDKRTP